MIIINSPEEMEKYYDAKTNTYRFVDEDGCREDVAFKCNIEMGANIYAWNINAQDIDAENINARNIDALYISYYAFCIAYQSFKCKSITGSRRNAVHMCLDGEIEYKGRKNNDKRLQRI